MAAPPGAIVRLAPYDWAGDDPPPTAGDCVVSTGGSAYLILDARQTNRPGRLALTCAKLASRDEIPAGARVVDLEWYPRKKTRVPG